MQVSVVGEVAKEVPRGTSKQTVYGYLVPEESQRRPPVSDGDIWDCIYTCFPPCLPATAFSLWEGVLTVSFSSLEPQYYPKTAQMVDKFNKMYWSLFFLWFEQ